MEVTQSCLTICDLMDPMEPDQLLCPWYSPDQNTGVGSYSLLQGIFPTQELNSDLLYFMNIFYHLSHQESSNQNPNQWPNSKKPIGSFLGWELLFVWAHG